MKKIKVFRLENINKLGPFRGGHRNEANLLKGHFGIRNCLIDYEIMKPRMFKKFAKNGWLCAWSVEEDFDNWLNDHAAYFESLGYFKVAYEVSQYKLCGDQKLFHIDEKLDEYVYCDVVGHQVFFNPKNASKLKPIHLNA